MRVFESKIDLWFYLLISLLILVSIFVLHKAIRQPSLVNLVVSLITAVLGVGLPLWLLASTKYILSDNELIVKSGPVNRLIPLESIVSVKETHNPISSPALSLDRLEIKYGNNQRILISPKDKQGFRKAIGF